MSHARLDVLIATFEPMKTRTPSGMKTGDRTVSAKTATRPSGVLPPQMEIQANPALAVGARNSRITPSAMSGCAANPTRATAHASTGMTVWRIARMARRGAGLRSTSRMLVRRSAADPAKTTTKKTAGTAGTRRPTIPGRRMPSAMALGTTKGIAREIARLAWLTVTGRRPRRARASTGRGAHADSTRPPSVRSATPISRAPGRARA